MIEICQLTKRMVDPGNKNKLPHQLEQVKIFSMNVGHGVGTVDFMECVDRIEDDAYDAIVQACGEYAKFKLGNLTKYFEVEIYPEHAEKLYKQMPDCPLKDRIAALKHGFIVIRKGI